MKNKYIYTIVIAFLLNIFAYAMESESQWKKIDINTSIIPINITCKENGDLYLLGKANKTASPTIFKLDKDKNRWESMPKLDITTDIIDLFRGLKKSIEYIHAVQGTLFAIVKEQSNESTYKIMHEDIGLLKQSIWKQIYPPNNETESRSLIRLSGQTLNQIWVTFKEHEIEKSFSLTKKIDNTFKKEPEKDFFYRNVDTNNRSPEITMWALSSKRNKLITNTKYEAPKNIIYSLNAQLSPTNIFVDDNENIYGIDKNQIVYKWDFDLKNFMALENSPNQIISLCTMPNNVLYSLDTKSQLYTWQETGEQRNQRLKTNKDLLDIRTQEEPTQSEFYITAKSSSPEDDSLSEIVKEKKEEKKPLPIVQQPPKKQEEEEQTTHQSNRSKDQSSYEVIKEKQQQGLSPSPTKHFLNQYIEKAQKEIPEKPKSIISPEESRLRKFIISTVGLTATASTAAYAKGYITFTDIIKYTLTTGFTLTTSLVIRDALRYTRYNWKLKKQQEEQNWYDNLIKLKKTTGLRGITIGNQSYAVANEFEFKKPDHQDSNNYNFYLMPTDDYLVFTFKEIINKFKDNKSNIKYIAVRPTPGITEDRAILGTIFPRIIISTNISDIPDAQKMLSSLKNITEGILLNNRDIPNIGKQPSFSQKTLNKLIYWSLGSFDYHKNEYNMSSWLQRLQGLPKPEKSLDREYLPKPVSSDHE